jgi:O-antigen/teichoic acid export membrane protein
VNNLIVDAFKNYFNLFKKSADFLIALSEVLSKLATFIVIPVSGLFLSTQEFTIWVIIFPSIQILASALSFGMPNYLLRAYFVDESKKIVDPFPVYSGFLILCVLLGISFLGVKLLFSENFFLSWTFFFLLVTNSFLLIIQQKYQAEKNGLRYFTQSLIWRIGFAFVILIFCAFKMQIASYLLMQVLLIIQMILLIIAIYMECLPFRFKFELSIQKEIFNFGFPLFLIGLLQYITFMNSRYFVYNKGDADATAIFSIIHTFVGALNLLFVVFVRIYIPKLFEMLNGSRSVDSIQFYKSFIFSLLEILSIFIFIALFIYSDLYKSDFIGDIFLVTPILILGQLFYCFQLFVIDSLLYYGKTSKLFIISLVSALFSVLIGYLLVQWLGIYGGALGIAISQLISLLIVLLYTKDLFNRILGIKFCLEQLLRLQLILVVSFISYEVFGKSGSLFFCIFLLAYLIWKLNFPLILKKLI